VGDLGVEGNTAIKMDHEEIEYAEKTNTTQHSAVTNTSLMLFRQIIVVQSVDHMKPINTLREQNAELQTVTAGSTYNYQWALKS
jgi:hypothetical protein